MVEWKLRHREVRNLAQGHIANECRSLKSSASNLWILGSDSQRVLVQWIRIQVGGASLIAQLLKNSPAMQETPIWFLGGKDPLEKGKAIHSSLGNSMGCIVYGVTKSQTQLSAFHFHFTSISIYFPSIFISKVCLYPKFLLNYYFVFIFLCLVKHCLFCFPVEGLVFLGVKDCVIIFFYSFSLCCVFITNLQPDSLTKL